MAVAPDDGSALLRAFGPSDPQADARALWAAWNHGVSPATTVARRSDLRHFGAFTWRVGTEIATVRRVAETLRGRSAALRELALAWHESERERGVASVSLRRRWSVLSSLARFVRGGSAAPIGTMPAPPVRVLERRDVSVMVARASEARDWPAAAMIGLAGERGMAAEQIADLRVAAALAIPCSSQVRAALVRVCEGRRLAAFAFEGRSRGGAISRRGVGFVCERWGATVAALRRASGRGKDRTA